MKLPPHAFPFESRSFHMKLRRPRLLSFAIILATVSLAPFATAQEGITVAATGQVEIRPDLLMIRGTLIESADDAEDAAVAFRDTRRRALGKLEKLEIDNLTFSTQSLQISRVGAGDPNMAMMIGGFDDDVDPIAQQMTISQDVTITVAGIDQMEEDDLIELVMQISSFAMEAGLNMTPAVDQQSMLMRQMGMSSGTEEPVALFKVSNPEAAAEAAAQDAIASARKQAERLARLAGVELGPITAIIESPLSAGDSNDEDDNSYLGLIFGMMADAEGVEPMTTSKLEDITLTTQLRVTFSIAGE